MRNIVGIFLALVLLPGVAKADLIVNGGFETGDFTDWLQTGNTGFTGVGGGISAHSGLFGAFFGPVGSTGAIEQVIATTIGATYQFSYWLHNDDGSPNFFESTWDGAVVQSLTDSVGFGYTHFTFNVTAVSAATIVRFEFRHDPAWYRLDDVSVVEVPVPAGAMLAGIGMLCIGGFAYRRRQLALRA